MDIRSFWARVGEESAALPATGPYFLTSLDNPEKGTTAGAVCDIPDRKQAAIALVNRTHRRSTPDEIAQFHANLKRQTDELAQIELQRKQQFAMPQDLQDLVRAAATALATDPKPAPRPAR